MATELSQLDSTFRATRSLFVGNNGKSPVFGDYSVVHWTVEDDAQQHDERFSLVELMQTRGIDETEDADSYPFGALYELSEKSQQELNLRRGERYLLYAYAPLILGEKEEIIIPADVGPAALFATRDSSTLRSLIFPITKRQRDRVEILQRVHSNLRNTLLLLDEKPTTLTPYYYDTSNDHVYFAAISFKDLLEASSAGGELFDETTFEKIWPHIQTAFNIVYHLAHTRRDSSVEPQLKNLRNVLPGIRTFAGRAHYRVRNSKVNTLYYSGPQNGVTHTLLSAVLS